MSLCSVIVTYNRLKDLKYCLEKYDDQVENIDAIVIVDNNSTDGTKEFLEQWKDDKKEYEKYLIFLEKNIGGSGGFYEGLRFASEKSYDWIWVHDDDAFLEPDTIQNLKNAINKVNESEVAAICGKVIDHDKINLQHRCRIQNKLLKVQMKKVPLEEYKKDSFELNTFSYVGTAINNNKLKLAGLTNRDFFIYFDDTEHGYRLSKQGKILCYPSIEIIHNQKLENVKNDISWKSYYGIRNNIFFLKKNFSLLNVFYYVAKQYKDMLKEDIQVKRLKHTAIKDGLQERLGVNDIYKPGWKVK